ncbi:MAG: hypothetical protein M3032_01355, partial [Verrucomicrobiota bacterium]|nr:hypothetical protein [Verrucomicrobiota bacterium]
VSEGVLQAELEDGDVFRELHDGVDYSRWRGITTDLLSSRAAKTATDLALGGGSRASWACNQPRVGEVPRRPSAASG